MADATIAFDPDETFEEPDVKTEVDKQEPTTEESSTEETKEPEVAEPTPDGEPDAEKEEVSEETEPDKAEEPKEEAKPQGRADERKTQVSGEIRDLVSQRNQLKQEIEQLNAQYYQPESIDQLVNQGMSQTDARIAAMEQKVELADYNNRVAEAQLVIGNESQRVIQDFPMFNPESPEFVPTTAADAAEILRSNLIYDPNTNQVIGSNVSPYQLYKTIADASKVNAADNKLQGQRDTEKMLASAEPVSSSVPKQKKEDPFLTGLLGK